MVIFVLQSSREFILSKVAYKLKGV